MDNFLSFYKATNPPLISSTSTTSCFLPRTADLSRQLYLANQGADTLFFSLRTILYIPFSTSHSDLQTPGKLTITHLQMESRTRNRWAMGLSLVFYMCLLFSPLAFVQTVKAEDASEYGTVIGIVCRIPPCVMAPFARRRFSCCATRTTTNQLSYRIWALPTLVWV